MLCKSASFVDLLLFLSSSLYFRDIFLFSLLWVFLRNVTATCFCYKPNAVHVSVYYLFNMVSGMGLDTLQNKPDFQNSIHTQLILEPLMYRIIKCADCSRDLFFSFLMDSPSTKMMCENEMLILALPKVNVSENSLAIKTSFRFFFAVS